MARYLLKRLLEAAAVLVVALTLAFVLVRLSGDPTSLILPADATEEARADLRHSLGLDRPVAAQYADFVARALRGDFGRSYFAERSVQALIMDHLPQTALLAGTAVALGVLVAIPLGVVSAVRRGSAIDRLAQAFALAGYSMPAFWSGILLIQLFGVLLGWLPTFGSGSPAHLILPALNLTFWSAARLSRLTRSAMIESLKEDYVRTARSKGLAEAVVVAQALRNALLPVVTLIGIEIGVLLGGAVLTESVFAWPGIGWLALRSISRRDFPVVQGIVGYVAFIFVGINLATDLSYFAINPRIRHGQ